MRFTLFDLLIFDVLFFVGLGLFRGAVALFGIHFEPAVMVLASIHTGALFALLVASPIYRLVKARPMVVPGCPHCGQDQLHALLESAWPRELLGCSGCGDVFEVWYLDPGAAREHDAPPRLTLRWPRYAGRWVPPPSEPAKAEELNGALSMDEVGGMLSVDRRQKP